jgi:ABC-type transport system involved in multi-copper enzyme maturation permease subunit
MRIGLGPVFFYECLTNSRRWQGYAIRAAGVAGLLAAMGTIAGSQNAIFEGRSVKEYSQVGESYFYAMIGMELALVMLAAPAATAGAICVDRSRGTLEHILVTDLSDAEIVLGKLAARLLPVMGLVTCSAPVLAISTSLGGIDPIALILAFGVIVAVGVFGCTLALALSIWARKPYEVVLAVYAFWAAALLAAPLWGRLAEAWSLPPISERLLLANPFFLAFFAYQFPSTFPWWECAVFFGTTLGSSAILALLAVWRTRPSAIRSRGRAEKTPKLSFIGRIVRRLPGPSLDRDPILWREWHRTRSPRMSFLLALLMGSTTVACFFKAYVLWYPGSEFRWGSSLEFEVFPYLLHVLFGLLVLSAVAPMSLSEERQRGSLDVLMSTPLSTWEIIRGKWLSVFRLVPWLAVGPGMMALAVALSPTWLAWNSGEDYRLDRGDRIWASTLVVITILAHGAAITSLGLLLATWIRRQSRAIAISVGVFVVVSIGWPMMALSAAGRSVEPSYAALAALSPIFSVLAIIEGLALPSPITRNWLRGAVIWDICIVVVALGFLRLTVRIFERCLGRMPERGVPITRSPAGLPSVRDTIYVRD